MLVLCASLSRLYSWSLPWFFRTVKMSVNPGTADDGVISKGDGEKAKQANSYSELQATTN